jgi:hypothetical protein
MTWRVVEPDRMKTSLQESELQTLIPNESTSWPGVYRWVTVARGNGFDLKAIADALNQARFAFFNVRRLEDTRNDSVNLFSIDSASDSNSVMGAKKTRSVARKKTTHARRGK